MNNCSNSTVLLPLPLLSRGTIDVESLTSYLFRTSYCHGVSTGVLIKLLYEQSIFKKGHGGSIPRNLYFWPEELIRPFDKSNDLLRLLEHATGISFAGSTVLFFGESPDLSLGEMFRGLRWCPDCLSEMVTLGCPPYFKLIWHMVKIPVCHLHSTPLLERCKFCNSSQFTYVRKYPIQFCQKCERFLGNQESKFPAIVNDNKKTAIRFDILDLFKNLAEIGYKPLPSDGLNRSLDTLLNFLALTGESKIFIASCRAKSCGRQCKARLG